eukprot:TRINITY_DN332_c2_g2_i2.p1 TRINITY_DN332_c2_g2~~TRINITY_DN332_c2_g2_i2.p1  ORF type:complete len:575 (+),score=122.19 TRINITY_DN332_c2_g2_i2:81-1727(+)
MVHALSTLVAVLALHLGRAEAQRRFLGTREGHNGFVSMHGPTDLLAELEELDANGRQNVTEARANRLEEALRPVFKVAPKDSSGRVDAKAARYLLHRLFVERHGWFVSGIENHGAIRNSSKISEALHHGDHFTLRQLARFAATLETLVHNENAERLQKAFEVYGFARNRKKTMKDAQRVIEAYMVIFVMSHRNPSNPPGYWDVIDIVQDAYPTWPDTKAYGEEVLRAVYEGDETSVSLWDVCLNIVEEIGERYGRWQNKECRSLKKEMMTMETPGTARVPLHAFWGNALHDVTWAFTESVEYLEQLGALEGSEAPHHSVVIPNYIYSAANCVAGSKYYDVCCINVCEELLGQLEAKVEAPAASPERLAELVGNLPSDTVSAPRDLPSALTSRLDEIASHHGGLVPLHGRLFAQFLHHAYPHECPYPYLTHATPSKDADDWIQLMDEKASMASHDYIRKYLSAVNETRGVNNTVPISHEIPWTNEEELFMQSIWLDGDGMAAHSDSDASMKVPLVGLMMVVVIISYAFRRHLLKALGVADSFSEKGHFV